MQPILSRSDGSAAEHDERSRSRAFIVIAILFALQMCDGIDQAVLAFTAPFVGHELGLGFEPMGRAFSAGYVGTALGAVLFGTLADRLGRKATLCISAISFSLGSLTTILVETSGQMIAVRFVTGLALGGLFPVVATLILATVPRHLRATAVTLVSVGAAAGVGLCGPLVAVLEPRFGWRSLFIVGGTAPLLLSILAIVFIAPGQRVDRLKAAQSGKPARHPFESVSTLFREGRWRTTLMLWLAFIASAVPMFFSLSWLPSLAHGARIQASVAAIGPSLFSIAGLVVALVVARQVDRLGLRVLALSTAMTAPALVFLGQSFGGGQAFLIACVVAGALSVSSVNIIGAIAGMLYPDALRARGVGWAVAIMRLGAAIAPWLGGVFLAHSVPTPTIFLGLALSPIISALALFVLANAEPPTAQELAGTITPEGLR